MTTTATPKTVRPHIVAAEIQEDTGYRWWTSPMPSHQLDAVIWQQTRYGAGLSDYDCATTCWCVMEG